MLNIFTAETVSAVQAAVSGQLATAGIGHVNCKTVAAEVGLDPDDGHTVISMLIRHGACPGFETRQKLGIVPDTYVPASAAKAAKDVDKLAARAAEAAAKAAKAAEKLEKATKAAGKVAKAAELPAAPEETTEETTTEA